MKTKVKWLIYEMRYKFRRVYFHKALCAHICEKYFNFDLFMPFYANQWIMGKKKTHSAIGELIDSGKPFCVSRFGNTELSVMVAVLKRRLFGNTDQVQKEFDEWFLNLQELSGFFPNDPNLAEEFTDLMLDVCKDIDILAEFHCKMDDYIITEYMKQTKVTFLNHIEPWRYDEPWSSHLENKKVLVIHPFTQTILEQYEKREKLFENQKTLPNFELKTLKAVQTIAGEKDPRFDNWFEALEYMYEEALKIDFDIAIIGCGAYGMPLAVKLKRAGKQAIHFGGATQILFGIKGRRWVDNPRSQVVFNEAWVYPSAEEKPKNCDIVENHCYW